MATKIRRKRPPRSSAKFTFDKFYSPRIYSVRELASDHAGLGPGRLEHLGLLVGVDQVVLALVVLLARVVVAEDGAAEVALHLGRLAVQRDDVALHVVDLQAGLAALVAVVHAVDLAQPALGVRVQLLVQHGLV